MTLAEFRQVMLARAAQEDPTEAVEAPVPDWFFKMFVAFGANHLGATLAWLLICGNSDPEIRSAFVDSKRLGGNGGFRLAVAQFRHVLETLELDGDDDDDGGDGGPDGPPDVGGGGARPCPAWCAWVADRVAHAPPEVGGNVDVPRWLLNYFRARGTGTATATLAWLLAGDRGDGEDAVRRRFGTMVAARAGWGFRRSCKELADFFRRAAAEGGFDAPSLIVAHGKARASAGSTPCYDEIRAAVLALVDRSGSRVTRVDGYPYAIPVALEAWLVKVGLSLAGSSLFLARFHEGASWDYAVTFVQPNELRLAFAELSALLRRLCRQDLPR